MDPFTKKILEQARERQKLLKRYTDDDKKIDNENENKDELCTNKDISSTKYEKERKSVSTPPRSDTEQYSITSENTEIKGSGSPLRSKTFNIQRDNINMEIKVTSSDNIRMQVEIEEESSNNECEDIGLRKDCKDRLNRLGRLYAGGDDADISSPIHRTEEKFSAELIKVYNKEESAPKKIGKGLKALANLAEEINHREDDLKSIDKEERLGVKKFGENKAPSRKYPAPKPPRPSMIPECPIKDKISRINNGAQDSYLSSRKPVPGSPKKTYESPKKPVPGSPKKTYESPKKQPEATPKALKWDRQVLDSLESQGFQRKSSDVKLVYEYSNKEENEKNEKNFQNRKQDVKASKENQGVFKKFSATISDKAARFEAPQKTITPDPSSLSLSERKALFERNKGEALIPKAPFSMSIPIKETKTVPKSIHPVKTTNEISNKCSSPAKSKAQSHSNSPVKPSVPQASGIASTMAALLQNKQTISQSQIENDMKQQRNKELQMLNNRFNNRKEQPKTIVEEDEELTEHSPLMEATKQKDSSAAQPSPIPCRRSSGNKRPSVSPKVAAVLEDVKRIKVSPSKPGRLYPSLSDIDGNTETESESRTQSPTPNNSSIESNSEDDINTSFGRDIMETISKNQTPRQQVLSDESNTDISDVLEDMDEYLEEALTQNSPGPTPPKRNKSLDYSHVSHSFNYKDYSPNVSKQSKSPVKSYISSKTELPTHVVDGEDVVPLTHTVSFYRKQNMTPTASPVKQIIRRVSEETCPKQDDRNVILDKIKSLQDEVNKQQLIIAQTSQALNLCNSTLEFMGSTEQVEAEKVLLLSTHRRQAILNEIQRLKVEGTLRPQNSHAADLPIEKGILTISNIKFQLKREYVRALSAAGGKGHHVTCLVKCGEDVLCSKLVSTVASTLKNPCYDLVIPGTITLKNIYSDFAVTFEVYCLQAQEELIPHELKYHIKKSNKATPKKSKHDSLLSRPVKESPAGPNAVRSPSFALMGYVVFSIRQMNKKTWTLNNTPAMSPLDGTVEMVVSCEFAASEEYRGFLTMFEDISGFGAWHRRWCLLKGNTLSYWKYPDDERKQPPIDSIDLKTCITKEVGPVSRDICARLNTLLVECERESLPQDKDSLVIIRKGDKTIIRYLLSADTKEERQIWCTKLNSALTALRLWSRN